MLPVKRVILEAGRNHVGILVCTVKAAEWLSVALKIGNETTEETIGMFYRDSSVQNLTTVNLFAPVFNQEDSDEVTASLNVSLENMDLSLCSTDKHFTCSVTSKYGSTENGGILEIDGKEKH